MREDSESGKRAQADVAGLLDVFAGTEWVEAGRINDSSRKYPGDVCVRSQENSSKWEKAFEVRDKGVTETDVRIFGKKCADMGLREAAVLMASDSQPKLDVADLRKWGTRVRLRNLHGNWNIERGHVRVSELSISSWVMRILDSLNPQSYSAVF